MRQLRKYKYFVRVGHTAEEFAMEPYYKVSNLPVLNGSQHFHSEDDYEFGKGKAFFLFSWNGGQLWIPGRSIDERSTYVCGYVDVRAINGKVLLKSRLIVHGNGRHASFHLERPISLAGRYPNKFVFCGFRYPVVVGADFLHFEERRLGNLCTLKRQGKVGPIPKPPAGLLV